MILKKKLLSLVKLKKLYYENFYLLIYLLTYLLACFINSAVAQVSFPHNANNSSAERVSSFTVSSSGNDRLEVVNGTQYSGFIPTLWSYRNSNNAFGMVYTSSIAPNVDTGTSPVMLFTTNIAPSPQFNAPTIGDFPWGNSGTTQQVVNRPVFQWRNNSSTIMTMLPNTNVGIGTTSPSSKFHTNGTLRFENLGTVTTNTYVLTTDVNGNVSRQLASTLGGGSTNLCSSTNFLSKSNGVNLICSQVYDDGTSVGINTTSPTAKLHTVGTVRMEDLPTAGREILYELFVDDLGYVKKRPASTSISNSCTSIFTIPKTTLGGNLTCSQIFDNGTNVGIGTTIPSNKLTVNGAIESMANLFISDAIYKKNVKDIKNGLDLINSLNAKTYLWKQEDFPELNFDSKLQYGLIAQEVEKIIPDIVSTNLEGRKSINYVQIIPLLIQAVQQQQQQILLLQNKLDSNNYKQGETIAKFENSKIVSISPNPSKDKINIIVDIENNGIEDCFLVLYDLKGNLINKIAIKDRGVNLSRTFYKENIGSGTFIICLQINNMIKDSKKVIFN